MAEQEREMNVLSLSQLEDMLTLQEKLNERVHPQWRTMGFAWGRAIAMEAAELMEHIGWKWWKAAPETDLRQIRLELVDIWHFALSLFLESGAGPKSIHDYLTKPPFSYEHVSNPCELVDVLMSAANQKTFNGPAFERLMEVFGLNWQTLHELYVAKNVLNLFRQDHGYANGTYLKMWGGREDNVVLAELMAANPGATLQELMALLEAAYVPEKKYVNFYRHCGAEWHDTWSCACDDQCPVCGHDISPYDSVEVS